MSRGGGDLAAGRLWQASPAVALGVLLLVAAMMPTVTLLALDPRLMAGVSVWVKPLKFQASLAIHLVTVAWALSLVVWRGPRPRWLGPVIALMLTMAAFEIAYITLQAARGEASHFNLATPLTRALYTAMGIAAVILVATTAVIGLSILLFAANRTVLVVGAALGLMLGGIAGGITGLTLGSQPSPWIGGLASNAGGLPLVNWSRTGGDLRVAHFFGLHLMQALPLTVWVVGRLGGSPRLQAGALAVAAVVGVGVTWWTWNQAVAGLPLVGV